MKCPKCLGKLQKTTVKHAEMSVEKERRGPAQTYELEVDKCFACGGVWFDKGELDKYLKDGITVIDSPSVGAEMDMALNKKTGRCPRCDIEMTKKAAPHASDVEIDICPQCQGIWFDSTEIDKLEAVYQKKTKGIPATVSTFLRSLFPRR